MEILFALGEVIEMIFLIVGLRYLQNMAEPIIKKKTLYCANFITILICIVFYAFLFDRQDGYLLIRIVILVIYIGTVYKSRYTDKVCKILVLLFLVDILNLLFAIVTYPIARALNIATGDILAEIVAIIIDLIGYLVVLYIINKRVPMVAWNMIGNAKKGIVVTCIVIETVFVGLKMSSFRQEDNKIYLLCTIFILFGATILTLWLRDRKKQHDKFSELIKYEHRTREIIPAIEKALQDLKNMGLTKAEEQRMIAELEAICKSDRSCLRGRNRQVRSFETTGSPILDNQLEQFVEECEENGILLDVIVRAEITAFLDLEDVEILTVLQIVGDLYRNAFKAVSKNKEKKNLLICFGYNANDYYEIGIYDNGHPFPSQIKEQLGVRGVTVDGTGHGMADVFEHLHRHQASFVLEENPAKGFTFTKGIHVVFDEKDRMEILS